MSSVTSSAAAWSADPDWVSIKPSVVQPGAADDVTLMMSHGLLSGVVMEIQAPSTDHHEAPAGPGSSGGEDLHRQVRNYCFASTDSVFLTCLFTSVCDDDDDDDDQ